MHLRAVEKWALPAALLGGAALSPGSITGDAARMLTTFLGLVAASVLPTISLLINSMTASGRSVKSLNDLEAELQHASDALFLLFGCAAIVIGALAALATPSPQILERVPYLTTEVLPRAGQAVVVLFSTVTLLRVGLIPGILRRSLSIRHQIAVEEAKRKTLENAPKADVVRGSFATHPDFGKTVAIEDILPGDKH